jgi:hypothetical protein
MDPSRVPVRDAPCPHCGHLLWFTKSAVHCDSKIYETFIMRVGQTRLGPIPAELVASLIATIGQLVRMGRMPRPTTLVRLTATTQDWPQLVYQLEMIARGRSRHSWAYVMGAYVRKAFLRFREVVGS